MFIVQATESTRALEEIVQSSKCRFEKLEREKKNKINESF
jgi:hypothetical protein